MDGQARSTLSGIIVRAAGAIVGGVIAAALGMLVRFVAIVLRVTKPVVYYPLSLSAVGAVGVTIAFAVMGKWHDVLQAAVAAIAASVVLGVYASLAEWVDPGFFEPSKRPPWWWFI